MVPLVAELPALETVTVYVAPAWPCVKLPEWVLVMFSTGIPGTTMVVESLAPALADPPPVTSTRFTCGEVAFPATFTVTVIGG